MMGTLQVVAIWITWWWSDLVRPIFEGISSFVLLSWYIYIYIKIGEKWTNRWIYQNNKIGNLFYILIYIRIGIYIYIRIYKRIKIGEKWTVWPALGSWNPQNFTGTVGRNEKQMAYTRYIRNVTRKITLRYMGLQKCFSNGLYIFATFGWGFQIHLKYQQ
jgi:hypothetical protein